MRTRELISQKIRKLANKMLDSDNRMTLSPFWVDNKTMDKENQFQLFFDPERSSSGSYGYSAKGDLRDVMKFIVSHAEWTEKRETQAWNAFGVILENPDDKIKAVVTQG